MLYPQPQQKLSHMLSEFHVEFPWLVLPFYSVMPLSTLSSQWSMCSLFYAFTIYRNAIPKFNESPAQQTINIQSYYHLLAITKKYFWGRTTNSWWLSAEGLELYAEFWAAWITQFQNILTLYYTQDHWISGLCPLCGILKEYIVVETRPGLVNEISSV